jgi:hypothetical protein
MECDNWGQLCNLAVISTAEPQLTSVASCVEWVSYGQSGHLSRGTGPRKIKLRKRGRAAIVIPASSVGARHSPCVDYLFFSSRASWKNSRLRLVIAPLDSIYNEKNYNSGGVIATETVQSARPVTVTLYHDRAHESALFVPMGQP